MLSFFQGLNILIINLYLILYMHIYFRKVSHAFKWKASTDVFSKLQKWKRIHDSREMQRKECGPKIQNAKV